jgi:membrane-associated phospholipid phosphatase
MIPDKPPHRRRVLAEQSEFWTFFHNIELPIILFMQHVLFARRFSRFWALSSRLASATLLSFSPSVLYSLGYQESAKQLATSLVFYAIFSSCGKYFVIRRRPGSFPEVWASDCASTSSFPSRHTIGVTVLSSFFPRYVKWPYVVFMIADRLACGQHYPSDCLVGWLLGNLSVYVGTQVADPLLSTIFLIIALKMWSGGAKVIGGCLPLIMAAEFHCNSWLAPLVLLKFLIGRSVAVEKKEGLALALMIRELFLTSVTLYIVTIANRLLIAWNNVLAQ